MNLNIYKVKGQNLARPAQIIQRQPLRQQKVQVKSFKLNVKAKETGNVLSYLQDAFKSIFSSEKSDVDWSKTYREFANTSSSLDQQRLEFLVDKISEIKGCTDPNAANFNGAATIDDGSCSFDTEDEKKRVSLPEYLQAVIRNTWESNFEKSNPDETKIPKFQSWSFEGRIVSQRDIDKMLEFEKAIKTAMKDKKEQEQKQK